jgi:hypothetical protein
MLFGIDSRPLTDAQIAAAKNDGVRLAAGYLPQAGIDPGHWWSEADFQRVRAAGLSTFAYCSGLADPASSRAMSVAWGVAICLDVEGGIRPDGDWVQWWLDASGAGLYGNLGVHPGRTASFHVLALYPDASPIGTPESWVPGVVRPPGPCGWQFQGTTAAYGTSVDRGWYDDAFSAGLHGPNISGGFEVLEATDPIVIELRGQINTIHQYIFGGDPLVLAPSQEPPLQDQMKALAAQIGQLATKGVTVDQSAVLAAIADVKSHPTVASDPALLAKVSAIEANLNAPRPPA